MSCFHLSNSELIDRIECAKSEIRRLDKGAEETKCELRRLEEEKERRRLCKVHVPAWVLELLSAHARKRYENINPDHRTSNYAHALDVATDLVGKVWPRDLDGEHHGSTPVRKS